jgi:hypothetical protein
MKKQRLGCYLISFLSNDALITLDLVSLDGNRTKPPLGAADWLCGSSKRSGLSAAAGKKGRLYSVVQFVRCVVLLEALKFQLPSRISPPHTALLIPPRFQPSCPP